MPHRPRNPSSVAPPRKPPIEAVFYCSNRPKSRKETHLTRTPPIAPVVASMVKRLPEHLQELWLERAAIRQYDGGQSRDLADAMALLDVVRIHPQEALTCWI